MIAFHSDIVGSLLRPSYLLEAREQLERGELNPVDFKRIEDRAVDEAVTLQESAGLEVVTDGEMRRYAFYGGKPNQPPLKLRRSAGTLAKAEGRRAKRVSEPRGPRRACFARWGGSGGGAPRAFRKAAPRSEADAARQGQRPSREARKRAGVGPREH